MNFSIAALLVVWLAPSFAAREAKCQAKAATDSVAEVRLEPHDGQTQFKIGDPILVDLVFAGQSSDLLVNTNTTPYLPAPDLVNITPAAGWTRSHAQLEQGQDMSAVMRLGGDPVRVPILLNRTIVFEQPGHYEVKVTTDRLRTPATLGRFARGNECESCRTTNAVEIDVGERSAREDDALANTLLLELKTMPATETAYLMQHKPSEAEVKAIMVEPDPSVQAKKLKDLQENRLKLAREWEDRRREGALRLAYLTGDEAVRAKVDLIAAEGDSGDAMTIGPILIDGLPNSRNKKLQLELIQAAWVDQGNVPSSALQTALREAKELMHGQVVTDESTMWAGMPEQREIQLQEYKAEIAEIVATLPARSEQNRAQTIEFLKKLAVPNEFNRPKDSR